MTQIILKKATVADLPNLDKIRNESLPKLHSHRLNEQKAGKSEYMIAFEGKEPVGHVYINYQRKEPYHQCPILQDLFVKESKRKRGIATEIINQSANHLKEKGYMELGIDVEVDNEWIKNFYEQVGFSVSSGPHKQSWTEKDSGKQIHTSIYHLRRTIK